MSIKRLSKRTLSVLLCVLILISSSLVGAISASATTNWTRGASSYIYLDASNLFTGVQNSNWFTGSRYRLFVVTSAKVYSFKLGLAGTTSSSLDTQRDKTKLLSVATLNSFSNAIVTEGIDFISFVYISSAANDSTDGELHTNTSFDRNLVYDNSDNVISNPSYVEDYTGNYYGGISSEKGARMLFMPASGTHPALTMNVVGYSIDDLKPAQTIGTNTGGVVNYSGYALTNHSSSTSVGGTLSANSSQHINATYTSTFTVNAAASDGWSFEGWYDNDSYTGSPVDTGATLTYTVNGARTLYAKFTGGVETTYAQEAITGEGGSVSAQLEGVTQSIPFNSENGKNVTFTATPASGYLFEGWYDNSEYTGTPITDNPYTYKVKGEKTLYARFISSYNQSLSIEGNGTVSAKRGDTSINLPYTAVNGEEITLTAEADSGYEFDGWYIGSTLVASSEEYTYTVSGANAITAKFSVLSDYQRPGTGNNFRFNADTVLLFDTTTNKWVSNRIKILLFDKTHNKAYSRVLSDVPYAALAGRTASSIISKIKKDYNISWANIFSISFIYFDNKTSSNNFIDGQYSDLLDSEGNLTQEAILNYDISGYTQKYAESTGLDSASYKYYHMFSPGSDDDNALLSHTSATSTNVDNYPKFNQYSWVKTADNELSEGYKESIKGGTVTVTTAYKKSSSSSISTFFESNLGAVSTNNSDKKGRNTVSVGYGTKVVLQASVADDEEYTFMGWYDDNDNKLENTNKSNPLEYTYYSTGETTIYAYFAPVYQYREISSTAPKTGEIVKFNSNDSLSSISIPDTLDGHSIIGIASNAFKDAAKLKTVEIPSSVQTLADKAFDGCKGLDEVTVNSNDTVFNGEPFLNTRTADDPIVLYAPNRSSTAKEHSDNYYYLFFIPLTAELPDDTDYRYLYRINKINDEEIELVEYLGDTTVEKLTIPESIDGRRVVELSAKLFHLCKKIYYLSIPRYVTTIGYDALPKYTTYYDISDNNSVFKSEIDPGYRPADTSRPWETLDARSDIYSKDGLTFIRYAAGDGTRHSPGVDARRQYSVLNGVTTIAEGAFKNSSTHINTINLPNTVTTIGDDAFNYCLNLRTINIPSSVTSIGDNAFMNCRSLPNIDVYGSLGDKIFWGCIKLSEINIKGSGNYTIGSQAFSRCNSLNFVTDENDSITDIGANAFEYCANLSVIEGAGIVDKIKNNNLISTELIPEAKRFITKDNRKFIVSDGVMKKESDGNSFGIPSAMPYANIVTLGIQKKNNDSIRFITAINSDLLKDNQIAEYGYLLGKYQAASIDDDTVHMIRGKMDLINYDTSGVYKTELKGTDNGLCSDYGTYSANTKYKYVTVAIEGIDDLTNIIFTRFYIKTSDNKIFYSDYQTEESQTVKVLQYQTDEYGNQIYDENGLPLTEEADTEYQETVYNKYKGCAVQPGKFFT